MAKDLDSSYHGSWQVRTQTGFPEVTKAFNGSSNPDLSAAMEIAVLSPPGRTSPSHWSKSETLLTGIQKSVKPP